MQNFVHFVLPCSSKLYFPETGRNYSSKHSNEDDNCAASSTSNTDDQSPLIDEMHFLQLDDDSEDESCLPQAESKTISLQHYRELMQLIPQVERMKNIIKQKEDVIGSKDSQLKELQRALKFEWKTCIRTSHLSIVSTLYE